MEKKFIVFEYDIDLIAHNKEVHPHLKIKDSDILTNFRIKGAPISQGRHGIVREESMASSDNNDVDDVDISHADHNLIIWYLCISLQ